MKGLAAPKTELANLGKIRLGDEKVEEFSKRLQRNVLTRGKPLDFFRITTPLAHRLILEEVCELYGSKDGVRDWTDADGKPALQAILNADQLEVGIPTDRDPVSAYYETWAGGYCTSRCNLVQRQVPVGVGKDAHWEVKPCSCDQSDPQACLRVVRLEVSILGIHADGLWTLQTGSNYAYTHWDAAVQRCQQYALPGKDAPALLAIVSQTSKNKGRPDPLRNYKVCEIIPIRPITRQDLLGPGPEILALPSGETDDGTPPVPETSAEEAVRADEAEEQVQDATYSEEDDPFAGLDVQQPGQPFVEGVQPAAATDPRVGATTTVEPPPPASAHPWDGLTFGQLQGEASKAFAAEMKRLGQSVAGFQRDRQLSSLKDVAVADIIGWASGGAE